MLFFNNFSPSDLVVSLIFALIVLVESYKMSPYSSGQDRNPKHYPVGEVKAIADSPHRVFSCAVGFPKEFNISQPSPIANI